MKQLGVFSGSRLRKLQKRSVEEETVYTDVSKNRGGFTPQIIHLFIGFFMK